MEPDDGAGIAPASKYEALDIRIPCCDAVNPFRDATRNCGCGHYADLRGVSKSLLHRAFLVAETQTVVDRWKAFLFPEERLLAELTDRTLTNSGYEQAHHVLELQRTY